MTQSLHGDFLRAATASSAARADPAAEAAESRQAIIDEEVSQGKREAHSKLPYGLYDPKKTAAAAMPEPAAAVAPPPPLQQKQAAMPRVGDGGASWRRKAQLRARQGAREEPPLPPRQRASEEGRDSARSQRRQQQQQQQQQAAVSDNWGGGEASSSSRDAPRGVDGFGRDAPPPKRHPPSKSSRSSFLYGSGGSGGSGWNPEKATSSSCQNSRPQEEAPTPAAAAPAAVELTKEQLNKLTAQALKANLMGNVAEHDRIMKRISEAQPAAGKKRKAAAAPTENVVIAPFGKRGQLLSSLQQRAAPLSRDDLRNGSRRGKVRYAGGVCGGCVCVCGVTHLPLSHNADQDWCQRHGRQGRFS